MEIEKLNQVIELINNIQSTMQYDYIYECIDLLNIKITDADIEKLQSTKFYNREIDTKDIYTYLIIKHVENNLNENQLQYFHESLNNYNIKFTSNYSIIKERIETYTKINDKLNLLEYIETDNYILEFIKSNKDKLNIKEQVRLIISLKDNDNIKESYLEKITNIDLIYQILTSINDDNSKIRLYEKYKNKLEENDITLEDILPTMNDDNIKIEYIQNNSLTRSKLKKIIHSLQKEEAYLTIWNNVDIKTKEIIIYNIKDKNTQLKYLKLLNNEAKENNITINSNILQTIIEELPIKSIKELIKDCQNIKFDISEIIKNINDDNFSIELIKKFGNKKTCIIIRNNQLLHSDTILRNIDLFLEKEEVQEKDKIKNYIYEMYKTNNDIVHTINWKLLENKYVETLGLDKINILGSFPEISKDLISLNDKEFEVFYKCLNHYVSKNNEFDWNNAVYQMIRELHFGKADNRNITQYIEDINTINLDNLLHILLNGNNIKIKSQEDINNYHKLLIEKSNKQFESEDIKLKKDAIFIKAFGLTDYTSLLRGFRQQLKPGIVQIYNSYKNDIELIENEDIKKLFNFIKIVIETNSIEQLEEIYNKVTIRHLDTYKLESLLKNEYLKLYNKELLDPKNISQNEEGLYDAGVDFNILTTSVGAYYDCTPTNYQDDWNRPSLASPHFCASYIRNDMLGTAPVNNVLYGFSNMEENSLVLSGASDIYSTGASLVSKSSRNEIYYGPDKQINNTPLGIHKYNEMDFKRIQNGRKKQPDYILVFKKDGIIENIENSKKASQDWNNLPIVVIDVNKVLDNEKRKLIDLITKYYENPTQEILELITIKIRNNQVIEPSFANEINIEELKNMIQTDDKVSNILN